MKEKIKYIIGTIWLVVVMYFYYKNHSYYTDGFFGLGMFWILWIAPILSYVIYLSYTWGKGENFISINLSAKKIAVAFLLGMLFIANVAFLAIKPLMYMGPTVILNNDWTVNQNPTDAELENGGNIFRDNILITSDENFLQTAPEEIKPYLVNANIFEIQKGMLWTFIKVYLPSLLFILFSAGLGTYLHKIISRKQEHEESFEGKLIETVLGIFTMTSMFLAIALLGHFNILINLIVIGIIGILIRKELIILCKKILKWRIKLDLEFSNLIIPIGIFIFILTSINLLDNLSPMPHAWDGLNRYILVTRDIAESGGTLTIGSTYAWELILAFFYQIDSKIALFWTSFPGILNFIVIWLILRKFVSNKNAMLVIALLISMPMTLFHMAMDNKIDLAHWLLGSTVILSLLKSIDFEKKISIKDYSYIWIAAILAGFAFTVKLTGILLIFGLIATFALVESGWLFALSISSFSLAALIKMSGLNLGSDFVSSANFNSLAIILSLAIALITTFIAIKKKQLKQLNIKHFFILCALILLPILPWLGKNLHEAKGFSLIEIIMGTSDIAAVHMEDSSGVCKHTGMSEEYDRYLGYNPSIIIRTLAIPWHLTMNDIGAHGLYIDIGFSFLGFIVFTILFYKFSDKRKNLLLFFAVIYGFFWLIRANGVIWYGFPLLTFAALSIAFAYEELDKNIFGRFIILVSFLIWGVLAFNTRLNNFGHGVLLLNNVGKITNQEVQDNFFPAAHEIQSYLKEHEGIVYKVGTPYGFYIPDFFKRTYEDQLLDAFYCTYLSYDGDPIKMIKIFNENNIRFLIYDLNGYKIGNDPEGTLERKFAALIDFTNKYLEIIINDEVKGIKLLSIPTEAELLQKHPELVINE